MTPDCARPGNGDPADNPSERQIRRDRYEDKRKDLARDRDAAKTLDEYDRLQAEIDELDSFNTPQDDEPI